MDFSGTSKTLFWTQITQKWIKSTAKNTYSYSARRDLSIGSWFDHIWRKKILVNFRGKGPPFGQKKSKKFLIKINIIKIIKIRFENLTRILHFPNLILGFIFSLKLVLVNNLSPQNQLKHHLIGFFPSNRICINIRMLLTPCLAKWKTIFSIHSIRMSSKSWTINFSASFERLFPFGYALLHQTVGILCCERIVITNKVTRTFKVSLLY